MIEWFKQLDDGNKIAAVGLALSILVAVVVSLRWLATKLAGPVRTLTRPKLIWSAKHIPFEQVPTDLRGDFQNIEPTAPTVLFTIRNKTGSILRTVSGELRVPGAEIQGPSSISLPDGYIKDDGHLQIAFGRPHWGQVDLRALKNDDRIDIWIVVDKTPSQDSSILFDDIPGVDIVEG